MPSFLLQNIVFPNLFFRFIAKRIYQNNMVGILHLVEGIKMIEGKAYVTGIKWEEHDSGLLFRKQIVQEYDGKQMPLSSYSRCMPWELSQE